MPNRIIREGILTSERVSKLDWEQEVFYRRLHSVVDDFGRYSAHPALLRAALYPLKLETVREANVQRLLAAVEKARLVRLYEVAGKRYLEVIDFRQQVRAKESRYPQPPTGCVADATHVLGNGAASAHLDGDVSEDVSGDEDEGGGGEGGKPPSPLDDLLSAWDSSGFAKVVKLTDARRKAALARLADAFWREHYLEALQRMGRSAFCRGQNDRGWKADFEFFIRPDTLTKVLEGRYDDKEKPKRHPSTGQPLKGTGDGDQ